MCSEVQSDDDETYYSAGEATSRDASPLDRWELPPPPHTLPLPMVPTRPPPSAMCVAAPPAAIPSRPEPPSSHSQAIGYPIDVEKTMKIREIIARMPELVEVRVNHEYEAYHPIWKTRHSCAENLGSGRDARLQIKTAGAHCNTRPSRQCSQSMHTRV